MTLDWHTDGLFQCKEHPFSVLLGVCLSDVSIDFAGNLLVWPGTHKLLHKAKIGHQGQIDVLKLQESLNESPFKSNDTIESQYLDVYESDKDRKSPLKQTLPSLGPPYQVHLKSGDIVMLHPDLAHSGGPNTQSKEIRKMVYFRLKQVTACVCCCASDEVKPRKQRQHSGYVCCEDCRCGCPNGFSSWDEVVTLHRSNMWVDLGGVGEYLSHMSFML
jgi:Phytanoyl-CoA dioxygenase (PhyH)